MQKDGYFVVDQLEWEWAVLGPSKNGSRCPAARFSTTLRKVQR